MGDYLVWVKLESEVLKKATKKTLTRIEVIYHGQSVRGTEECKASESQLLWNIVLYYHNSKVTLSFAIILGLLPR